MRIIIVVLLMVSRDYHRSAQPSMRTVNERGVNSLAGVSNSWYGRTTLTNEASKDQCSASLSAASHSLTWMLTSFSYCHFVTPVPPRTFL